MDAPRFRLRADYQPAGDQPAAIDKLVDGLDNGLSHQTLLGVTVSCKTFTIANVIERLQRPTLVMAHNKTLAAQLYGEFRRFFPRNAVEYFVSYYDHYQPEAYVPATDTYIEKEATTNDDIDRMRLSATRSLFERRDVLIVRVEQPRTVGPDELHVREATSIGLRVGKVINHYKVGKHFALKITDQQFSFERRQAKIAQEAALDGIYVVRTSVKAEHLDSASVVRAYKDLSKVEQAFLCLKTVDLKVRPIYHHLEDRVRAHIFLCMLAYYVEWHMRRALAPILFEEDDPAGAAQLRKSIVAPAQGSEHVQAKEQSKRTQDDLPVHSFGTLLKDLATLVRNWLRPKQAASASAEFTMESQLTPVQQRAFQLLAKAA